MRQQFWPLKRSMTLHTYSNNQSLREVALLTHGIAMARIFIAMISKAD
jgi:hypothetical protein